MSKKGQRFFASASLVALGLIAGVMITQLGSAVAVTGQQARPAVNSGALPLPSRRDNPDPHGPRTRWMSVRWIDPRLQDGVRLT